MLSNLSSGLSGLVTYVMVGLVAVVVLAGAVVLIVDPNSLRPGGPFEAYLNDLKTFATSLGLLAVGRGIHLGLTNHGQASSPSYVADLSDRAGAADHPNVTP
jgi:hypothetical protein